MSQFKELFPEVFCPQRDPEGVSGRNIMTAAVPKHWYHVGTKQKRHFLILNPKETKNDILYVNQIVTG